MLELRARDAGIEGCALVDASCARLRDVAAGDDAGGSWFFVSVSEVSKAATLLSRSLISASCTRSSR